MREAITIAIVGSTLLVLILLATGKVRTTFIARPTGITVRRAAGVLAVFMLAVLLSMVIHAL
jgi:hypothetical protein